MSPRHFARSFRAEVGLTPARYVERLRLEAARRRLEESEEPVAAVALACGFGTAETMRRSLLRALGVGPAEYRRRFHTLPPRPKRRPDIEEHQCRSPSSSTTDSPRSTPWGPTRSSAGCPAPS